MGNCQDCCASLAGVMEGRKKKGRRTSGVFLIEPRPEPEEGAPSSSSSSSSGAAAAGKDAAAAGGRSDDVAEFLRNCLLRSGTFASEVSLRQLTPDDINRLVNAFEFKAFESGKYLFHQGDYPCEYMYIGKRGLFRGLQNKIVKAIMKEGDLMGEIGFFHETPRMLSIMADSKGGCSTYRLSKYDFRAIAEKGRDLNNIRMLDGLTIEQKYKIKDNKELVSLRAGQYLFKKGDEISDFYLVLSGIIQASDAETLEEDPKNWNSDFEAKEKEDGEGEDGEGGGEGGGGGGFFSFLGVWDSPPAPAAGADGDAPGDGVGSDSGGERRPPAAAAASASSTATEDFAIIPGGFIGAEAMLSGQTTSRHHYLAMKETTLLKVGRKMFDSDVFATVRPLLEDDVALRAKMREEERKEAKKRVPTVTKTPPPRRRRRDRSADYDENEEEDQEAAAEPTSGGVLAVIGF